MVHYPDIFRPEGTVTTNENKNNNDGSIEKKPDTMFLYFTVVTANLIIVGGASSLTWPSPVIPKLTSNDTSINPLAEPATTIQISMMVGLPSLAMLSGSLLSPLMTDHFGRKKMLQLSAACMVLCDVVIAFSTSIIYVIIARCIFMAFFNCCVSILIIFVIEICENHNRAKFGCFFGLCLPIGNLYGYLLGPIFSVRIFTLITSIPLIILVIFSFFTVETPVYLLLKGRSKECLQALRKLRSNKNPKEIQTDFDQIEFSLKQRETIKNATISSLFRTKQSRLGLGFAIIFHTMHFSCGAPIVATFLGPVFNDADTGLSGNMIAISVGIIKIGATIITTMIVEKFGRITLLLYSTLGCTISQLLIGFFFYLKYINSPIVQSIKLLPVISVAAFFVFYSIGLGPLPNTIASELFTSEFRSIALSISVTVMSIVSFFISTGFPLLAEYPGVHWCFWLFSLFNFVGAVALFALLPETGGKSIVEIQEDLKNYKFKPCDMVKRFITKKY